MSGWRSGRLRRSASGKRRSGRRRTTAGRWCSGIRQAGPVVGGRWEARVCRFLVRVQRDAHCGATLASRGMTEGEGLEEPGQLCASCWSGGWTARRLHMVLCDRGTSPLPVWHCRLPQHHVPSRSPCPSLACCAGPQEECQRHRRGGRRRRRRSGGSAAGGGQAEGPHPLRLLPLPAARAAAQRCGMEGSGAAGWSAVGLPPWGWAAAVLGVSQHCASAIRRAPAEPRLGRQSFLQLRHPSNSCAALVPLQSCWTCGPSSSRTRSG